MRLEPHDLRTGRAAAYITAECLPLLPRERFSPLAPFGRRSDDRFREEFRTLASVRKSPKNEPAALGGELWGFADLALVARTGVTVVAMLTWMADRGA